MGSYGNSDVQGPKFAEKLCIRSVSARDCMFGNVTVHAQYKLPKVSKKYIFLRILQATKR